MMAETSDTEREEREKGMRKGTRESNVSGEISFKLFFLYCFEE